MTPWELGCSFDCKVPLFCPLHPCIPLFAHPTSLSLSPRFIPVQFPFGSPGSPPHSPRQPMVSEDSSAPSRRASISIGGRPVASEAPSRRSTASLGGMQPQLQAGGADAPQAPPHRVSASGSGAGVPDVRWWGSAGSSESSAPPQSGQQYGGSGIPAPKPASSSGGDSGGRVAAMAARLEEQLRGSSSSRPSYADSARAAAAAVRDAGKPSAKPASFSGTPSRIPAASPSLTSSSSVPMVRGPVWALCCDLIADHCCRRLPVM